MRLGWAWRFGFRVKGLGFRACGVGFLGVAFGAARSSGEPSRFLYNSTGRESILNQDSVKGSRLVPSGRTPKKFPQHGHDVAFIRTNPLTLGYNPRGTTLKP